MSRILVATVPAAGHVQPLLPLARALITRGHELVWYTGQKVRGAVEGSGYDALASAVALVEESAARKVQA